MPSPPDHPARHDAGRRAIPCRNKAMHQVYCSALHRSIRDVCLALAWFADAAGANIWPANETLAHMVGGDVKTVRHARRVLEHLGVIVAEPGGGGRGGRGKTVRYRMDFTALAAVKPGHPLPRLYKKKPGSPRPPFAVENPGAQHHEPGRSTPETRALSTETRAPVPADRTERTGTRTEQSARTAADAAGARDRNRGKVFAGIRLQVSERQHAVVLNDLGAGAALLDLLELYATLDRELSDSRASFDALELVKRRAREAVAAARRSGARLRPAVDDDERTARDEERRRRADERDAQVEELWRLVDDDTRAACLRDAAPEIKPFAARMTDEARRRSLDAAACRIHAARFPTREDKLREIERLSLQRAGARVGAFAKPMPNVSRIDTD